MTKNNLNVQYQLCKSWTHASFVLLDWKSFDSTLHTWRKIVVKMCHKDLTHKMQEQKTHWPNEGRKKTNHTRTIGMKIRNLQTKSRCILCELVCVREWSRIIMNKINFEWLRNSHLYKWAFNKIKNKIRLMETIIVKTQNTLTFIISLNIISSSSPLFLFTPLFDQYQTKNMAKSLELQASLLSACKWTNSIRVFFCSLNGLYAHFHVYGKDSRTNNNSQESNAKLVRWWKILISNRNKRNKEGNFDQRACDLYTFWP